MNENLQKALQLRDSGYPSEAMELLCKIDPSTIDVYEKFTLLIAESTCLAHFGLLQQAREKYQAAAMLGIEESYYHVLLGLCDASLCSLEGNFVLSNKILAELITKHEGILSSNGEHDLYINIQKRRADALMHLQQYQSALPLLREIVTYVLDNRTKSEILCYLGLCNLQINDLDTARENYTDAIKLGVSSEWEGSAHYNLGIVYFKLGNFLEARKEFEKCEVVTHHDVSMTDLYAWLAKTCSALADKSASEKYSKQSKQN